MHASSMLLVKCYMQVSGSNLGNYCKQLFTEQKSKVYHL